MKPKTIKQIEKERYRNEIINQERNRFLRLIYEIEIETAKDTGITKKDVLIDGNKLKKRIEGK